MKITCERDALLTAFQMVNPVVPSRSPKPVLQNVKLEVTAEGGTLQGTDTEIGIRAQVAITSVDKPGMVLLPTGQFGPILREANDDTIRIESEGAGTKIVIGRSQFKLPSEDPLEFPNVGTFTQAKYYTVDAKLLKELIRRTSFATDPESTRFALAGVLWEFGPDKVTAVGTDGRRMAVAEGAALTPEGPVAADATTIIPARALTMIERALSDNDGECKLAVHDNLVLVQSPRATISARLLEGKFPRWRDVFPQSTDLQRVELPVGPLYSAVRQAAVVTTTESRGIDFEFSPGQLLLKVTGTQYGESQIDLPLVYDGPSVVIALDFRFLSDFLKVLNPEQLVTIEFRDGQSAAVLKTPDSYRYVIMPLSREKD